MKLHFLYSNSIGKRLVLLALLPFFLGCEKDDICDPATSSTPELIVKFYNAETSAERNATNLTVIANGQTEFITYGTTNKIKLPLDITQDGTTYRFILNGADTDATNDNSDELTFTYTRGDLYVSRACGYKKIFNLTNTVSDLVTPDTDNWIESVVINQPSVTNTNETHLKIYF